MLKDLSFTVSDISDAFDKGLTPVDLVQEVYRRIAAVGDPALFIHLRDRDAVLAEAAELPPRGPDMALWGIPYVVKDNIDVAGIPTTAACPAYAYTPAEDAFVVARLRAAGALMIGKTNLDQFATGLVGVRSPYGVPRNAVDPALVPGGSSSGSAVAVGHGLVGFSLGTDTAGSGRVPAALNGIVGLKPSLGTLSARGVVPACRTLDTVSIFASCVGDARSVLDVVEAFDAADPYARRIAPGPALPAAPRIGIPAPATRPFFGDGMQSASFEASLDRLRAMGAEIVELDFTPLFDVAGMLYEGAWVAERYTVIEDLLARDPEAVHPVTAQIIRAAEALSAADAFRGIYRLKALARAADAMLADVDMVCVPTIPTVYTVADLEADPVTPNSNLGTYTNFVNLLDMCGIAVPATPRGDGLPGSVTFLGPCGMDRALTAFAGRFAGEAADTPPSAAPGADELAIAVCGAHMSDLPLNHELTDRGGRLLQRTRTAPHYRLYALAGGPPARPGLLRIEKGAEIPLEVWALPKPSVGAFMAGIPQPLTIGTILLADGTRAHGFLVEAAGVQGAEDITHLDGWRNFLARGSALTEPLG